MPEQTVSIVGLLKDGISGPMKEVAKSTEGAAASVEEANTSFQRLLAIIDKTAQSAQKGAKALQDQTAAHKAVNSETAKGDTISHGFISRTEKVISRLIALQFALQNLSGSGFGQFQTAVESSHAFLQTFASMLAIIPGPVGALAGIVLGLAAAYKKLADAIAESNLKVEEMRAKQLEVLQKVFEAVGKAVVQQKLDRNNPIAAIADEMERVKENAESAAKRARELRQVLSDIDSDRNERKSGSFKADEKGHVTFAEGNLQSLITAEFAKQKELDQFRDGAGNFQDYGIQQQYNRQARIVQELIRLNNAQAESVRRIKEEQDAANATVEKAVTDYENLVKAQEALKKFGGATDELSKLLDQQLKAEQDNRDGTITDVQLAEKRLEIERRRLDIYSENREFYGPDEEAQNAFLEAERDRVKVAEDDLEITKEVAEARKIDADLISDRMDLLKRKAKEEAQAEQEFYRTLARGFGEALASGISNLIVALAQGQVALREFTGQFLAQLGQMIVKAIILKTVMAGLGLIGLNAGGSVPGADPASGESPEEFADGGSVPGPNVNADIVPAMLTPGEFVMSKPAVQHYGPALLRAMNARVASIAGISVPRHASGSVNVSGNYAHGGEVPYGAGAAPRPALATVIADRQEADRLLAGGDGAVIKYFARHADKIRAALRVRG